MIAEIRRRQCRVPTTLFWVGTRHCRLLYYSGTTVIDINYGCSRSSNSSDSESWCIPKDRAFSNLEPASSPTTT
jgi:hypothetical protein